MYSFHLFGNSYFVICSIFASCINLNGFNFTNIILYAKGFFIIKTVHNGFLSYGILSLLTFYRQWCLYFSNHRILSSPCQVWSVLKDVSVLFVPMLTECYAYWGGSNNRYLHVCVYVGIAWSGVVDELFCCYYLVLYLLLNICCLFCCFVFNCLLLLSLCY